MPTSSAATEIMYRGESDIQPLPRVVVRDLLEVLDRLALLLREPGRHVDAHAREQVALAPAVQLRRALAADAKKLAVLRAGRNLEGDLPFGGRHLDARAERRLRVGDRHLEHEV